jgi:hypothetical protein
MLTHSCPSSKNLVPLAFLLVFLSAFSLPAKAQTPPQEDNRPKVTILDLLFDSRPDSLPGGFSWVEAGGSDQDGAISFERSDPASYSFYVPQPINHKGEREAQTIRATAVLKIEQESGPVEVFIQHFDGDQNYLGVSGIESSDSSGNEWIKIAVEGQVPEGCRNIQVGVRLAKGATGTFTLDNLIIEEVLP